MSYYSCKCGKLVLLIEININEFICPNCGRRLIRFYNANTDYYEFYYPEELTNV